ncbi:MAG: DnaJ domain-containing protein, partial [Planctomycetes bacterium]|nr:DnaJ domain-containing protein [Planctomycetota bacterium]
PDRNPQQRAQAHARFLDLGEAYSVLKDPRQRRNHDRGRPQAAPSSHRASRSGRPLPPQGPRRRTRPPWPSPRRGPRQ